jgi:catechol 2,3-dioxygenase-like lactoylglutathione lyase family enzyme
MKIESLDHVALWVKDRDTLADFLTDHLGMHEIERTDAFTLVGSDARRGKLTLFAAEGERDPGPLATVALRVNDLEAAVNALPGGLDVERAGGSAEFTAPEGLRLRLVENDGVDYDLDHVVLHARDPEATFRELTTLGFKADGDRLRVAGSYLQVEQGDPGSSDRPLLNHIALLVKSAEDHIQEARERGLDISAIKDAENTYAVFIRGPEGVVLEYVEHKASFSLT